MAASRSLSRAVMSISSSENLPIISPLLRCSSCHSTAVSISKKQNTEGSAKSVSAGGKPAERRQAAERLSEPLFAPRKELPDASRPTEIRWGSRIANSLQFIGWVKAPVHVGQFPDDKHCAVTILAQRDIPQLRILVIFEGELAQVAAHHLREEDLVYVSGQLSADPAPLSVAHAQTIVQVLAKNVSLVQTSNSVESTKKVHGIHDAYGKLTKSFYGTYGRDLISNPKKWMDYRMSKQNASVKPSFPDFKHVDSGVGLWLDSAPDWVLKGINGLEFSKEISNGKGRIDSNDAIWRDLIANPQHWFDRRMYKLQKLVNPKAPDFKHKDSEVAIWLDNAPEWVLPEIERLEFNDEKSNGTDEYIGSLWRDLVANPSQWWDNRKDKLNGLVTANYPDFKQKRTGAGLWFDGATEWVVHQLEELEFDSDSEKSNGTDEGIGNLWRDLVANPSQWWDNREDKLIGLVPANYPDFKQKRTRAGLWFDGAPEWVLHQLEELEFDNNTKSWIDLIENPHQWWDHRSSKLIATAPDFKHKLTGKGLWLRPTTPAWLLHNLPPAKPKPDFLSSIADDAVRLSQS